MRNKILLILILVFSFSINAVQAETVNKNRAHLYITFKNQQFPQKVFLKVADKGRVTSITCSATKHKKNHQPNCGFGFYDVSISIKQVKYQRSSGSTMEICPELNKIQFDHGNLIISPKTNPTIQPSCKLKAQTMKTIP